MKLFNIRGLMMWFHYGNCRQEIEKLKQENSELMSQLPVLLGQIQEQKGILDYALHEKEQEIERLKEEVERLSEVQQDKKVNTSIREAWEQEANTAKVTKKAKK